LSLEPKPAVDRLQMTQRGMARRLLNPQFYALHDDDDDDDDDTSDILWPAAGEHTQHREVIQLWPPAREHIQQQV